MFEKYFSIYQDAKSPEEYESDTYGTMPTLKGEPSLSFFNDLISLYANPILNEYSDLESPFNDNFELLNYSKETVSYSPIVERTPVYNFQPTSTKNTPTNHNKKQILKGSKEFEKAFEEAAKINPEITKYKNFLTKTADEESDFRSNVQNSHGTQYYGYFLMGVSEIKLSTGLSVEEFRNNPVLQILGAVKLYKTYLKSIKSLGIYELGKEKGFSDDALVAGAWLGGPGGVRDFLKGIRDPSDSHLYGDKNKGTSVGKRMNLFNK